MAHGHSQWLLLAAVNSRWDMGHGFSWLLLIPGGTWEQSSTQIHPEVHPEIAVRRMDCLRELRSDR